MSNAECKKLASKAERHGGEHFAHLANFILKNPKLLLQSFPTLKGPLQIQPSQVQTDQLVETAVGLAKPMYNATVCLHTLLHPTFVYESPIPHLQEIEGLWPHICKWVDALVTYHLSGALVALSTLDTGTVSIPEFVINTLAHTWSVALKLKAAGLLNSALAIPTFKLWLMVLRGGPIWTILARSPKLIWCLESSVLRYLCALSGNSPCPSEDIEGLVRDLISKDPLSFGQAAKRYVDRNSVRSTYERIPPHLHSGYPSIHSLAFCWSVFPEVRSIKLRTIARRIVDVLNFDSMNVHKSQSTTTEETYMSIATCLVQIFYICSTYDSREGTEMLLKCDLLVILLKLRPWLSFVQRVGISQDAPMEFDSIMQQLIIPQCLAYPSVMKIAISAIYRAQSIASSALTNMDTSAQACDNFIATARNFTHLADKHANRCDNRDCAEDNPSSLKACVGCDDALYCSRQCQKLDWKLGGHRVRCIEGQKRKLRGERGLSWQQEQYQQKIVEQVLWQNKRHVQDLLKSNRGSARVIQVNLTAVPPTFLVLDFNNEAFKSESAKKWLSAKIDESKSIRLWCMFRGSGMTTMSTLRVAGFDLL